MEQFVFNCSWFELAIKGHSIMQCNVSHLFYITWKRSSHTNDQSKSPFLLPFERSNLKDLLLGVSGQLDSGVHFDGWVGRIWLVCAVRIKWNLAGLCCLNYMKFGWFVLFKLSEIWVVCVVWIKWNLTGLGWLKKMIYCTCNSSLVLINSQKGKFRKKNSDP
jgi:hypothetical protein